MSWENQQPIKVSLKAGATLATKQYYFVKMSADDTVIVCAGTTDLPIGVLQNHPASGETAEVVITGVTKVSADAALTAGQQIGTSSDGQAAPYAAGTDTTKYIAGQVIEGAAAAGGLATAVIDCANLNRGA